NWQEPPHQDLYNRITDCSTRNTQQATHTSNGFGERVTVVIAWGKRPVPFRTRKLRPTAPMVLHSRGCGRVGHRRTTSKGRGPAPHGAGPPPLKTPHHTTPPTRRPHPLNRQKTPPAGTGPTGDARRG